MSKNLASSCNAIPQMIVFQVFFWYLHLVFHFRWNLLDIIVLSSQVIEFVFLFPCMCYFSSTSSQILKLKNFFDWFLCSFKILGLQIGDFIFISLKFLSLKFWFQFIFEQIFWVCLFSTIFIIFHFFLFHRISFARILNLINDISHQQTFELFPRNSE
jgi:hypothetical protein